MNTYSNSLIEHTVFRSAYKQLKAGVFNGPHEIYLVIGPTGTGKSTALKLLEGDLIQAGREKSRVGLLSHVHMRLKAPPSGPFNLRHFEHLYLRNLNEPLAGYKECPEKIRQKYAEIKNPSRYDLSTLGTEYFLEQSLRQRRPLATLLDEGQHLAIAGSHTKLRQNLEYVKSLANNGDVKHVLFGTYDLYAASLLSGQITRRTGVIHLRRYLANEEDAPHFLGILNKLTEDFQLSFAFDVSKQVSFFYRRCLGCIGLLKNWFHSASNLYGNKKKLTMDDMDKVARSGVELASIMREIAQGELLMREAMPFTEQLDLPFPDKTLFVSVDPSPPPAPKKKEFFKRKLNRAPIGEIVTGAQSQV